MVQEYLHQGIEVVATVENAKRLSSGGRKPPVEYTTGEIAFLPDTTTTGGLRPPLNKRFAFLFNNFAHSYPNNLMPSTPKLSVLACLFFLFAVTSAQDATPTWKGHTETVYSVSWSSDGKLVASGSFDKSVAIRDAVKGQMVREYTGTKGHTSSVLSVHFSKDGAWLASGGSDSTARVWDVPMNSPLREFKGEGAGSGIASNTDGKLAAFAFQDGTVLVFNPVDGKTVSTIKSPSGVNHVSMTGNGNLVGTVGADGVIRTWNPVDAKLTGTWHGSESAITGFALTAGGSQAQILDAGGWNRVFNLPVPAPKVFPQHKADVVAFAVSGDGQLGLTASVDKTIKVLNLQNGQLARELTHTTPFTTANFSSSSPMILAGTPDGKLLFWNSADGKSLGIISASDKGITSVGHQGDKAISTSADGKLRLWSTPILGKTLPIPDKVVNATLAADGKRFVTVNSDKVIRILNATTGQVEKQFGPTTTDNKAADLVGDLGTVASTGADELIRFWNIGNGQQSGSLAGHTGAVTAIKGTTNQIITGGVDGAVKVWTWPYVPPKVMIHPDAVTGYYPLGAGEKILTSCNDKQARVWNVTSAQAEKTFPMASAITAITANNDASLFAISGADKTLVIRNAEKELQKVTLPAVGLSVSFNPNNQTLAVALADNSVRLIKVADGKEEKKIDAASTPVTFVSYLPKGDLILTASGDKALKLWEVAGKEKSSIALTAVPSAISISRDGTKVAVASDKTISLISLADGKTLGTITTTQAVTKLGFNNDGTSVIASSADNKSRTYGADGKVQEAFVADGAVSQVGYHPDGKRLVVTSADKTLKVFTPHFVTQAHHTGPVNGIALSTDGAKIYSVSDDKTLKITDAKTGKQLESINAHEGPINKLILSTDGKKALTVSNDKTAKIWDTITNKVLATCQLTAAGIAGAINPLGTKVAIATLQDAVKKVLIFDATTGEELQTLEDPVAPIRSLHFFADNRTLLLAGDDKNFSLQDTPSLLSFVPHKDGLLSASLITNGTQIVTIGKDKTIKVWGLDRKEVRTITAPGDITAFSLSRDGQSIVAFAGKAGKVWQLSDGKELFAFDSPVDVLSVDRSTDGTRVYIGGPDNLVRVYLLKEKQYLQGFPAKNPVKQMVGIPNQPSIGFITEGGVATHSITWVRNTVISPKAIAATAWSNTGTHVVAAGEDKLTYIVNIGNGTVERKLEDAKGALNAVAVGRNGTVIATGGAEKQIRLYNFADGVLNGTINTPAPIVSLTFSPNNLYITAACDNGQMMTYNAQFQANQPLPPEFGRLVQSPTNPAKITSIQHLDTEFLLVNSVDKVARQWKVAGDAPYRNFQHPQLVDCVQFDPVTGKTLATGCHDGNVRTFDVEKNAALKTIAAHTQPTPQSVYSIVWSNDGKQILSASQDKTLKLWDATAGTIVKEFKAYDEKAFPKGHQSSVYCAAFSSDGKYIVSGSLDKTIKLWNVADGSVAREFPNPDIKGEPGQSHPSAVHNIKITADNKYIISCGPAPKNKGFVAVWNLADGKLVTKWELDNGPAMSLSINKEGTQIAVGCGPKNRLTPDSEIVVLTLPK